MADFLRHSARRLSARTYVVVPCALLVAFFAFQRDFHRRREERERIRAEQLAATGLEQERQREALRAQAATDQRQRAEAREREERQREETRLREYDTALETLETQTAAHLALAENLEREIAEVDALLGQRRTRKQQADQAAAELAESADRQRMERRLAELETQRTLQIVLAHLADRGLVAHPILSPPLPGR